MLDNFSRYRKHKLRHLVRLRLTFSLDLDKISGVLFEILTIKGSIFDIVDTGMVIQRFRSNLEVF